MVNSTDVKYIIDCAKKGDEQPFNNFFDSAFQKIRTGLCTITKSEEDAKEVFIISMQKFWERFVINQEQLPHNSIGYIFMMCKNAWLMQKRNPWSSVSYSEDTIEKQKETAEESSLVKEDKAYVGEEFDRHKALAIALETLSYKCKALIENELDINTPLKELQETLGYDTYQALVQAKYNCKKRLIKKVYEVLEKIKKRTLDL
ncbi:hypothetical protein ABW636_17185 [Aquimarina sp. 2201CG1-2-11]|uniref:RNA polymerase sigma factor n=1 Tax=Aquimarina discodermiae TaxID=3231043 RepID=UPI003462315A